MPTVIVTTDAFEQLTREVARATGFDDARIVTVAHPLGGVDEASVRERATAVVEHVLLSLSS